MLMLNIKIPKFSVSKQNSIFILLGLGTIGVAWVIGQKFFNKRRKPCESSLSGYRKSSKKKIDPWKKSYAHKPRKFYCSCPGDPICNKKSCCKNLGCSN